MEEHRQAVQRMQDYIAAHLCETIALADLSAVSLFSPMSSLSFTVQPPAFILPQSAALFQWVG
ncbi:MAG: hypothetical protein RSD95_12235 [Clostridia bacterium]